VRRCAAEDLTFHFEKRHPNMTLEVGVVLKRLICNERALQEERTRLLQPSTSAKRSDSESALPQNAAPVPVARPTAVSAAARSDGTTMLPQGGEVYVASRDRSTVESGELSCKGWSDHRCLASVSDRVLAGELIKVTQTDTAHSRMFGTNLMKGGRPGWIPSSFLKKQVCC
jgi:hypothetical protein